MFLLAAGIFIVCNVIFVLFGSGSIQQWNYPPEKVTEEEDKRQEIKKDVLSLINEVIQLPFSRIWD